MCRSVSRRLVFVAALGLGTALSAAPSLAQQTEWQIVRDAQQQVVQSHIFDMRNDIWLKMHGAASMFPMGYANQAYGSAGSAMAMATKAPILTKAPPAPVSNLSTAIWASGSVDLENQSGTFLGANIGIKSQTYSGIGGFDITKTRIFADSDALLLGFLGGDTVSNVQPLAGGASTATNAAIGGVYAAYVPGDFSEDWSFTGTPTRSVTLGAAVNSVTYVFSNNVQYRFTLPDMWWVEPTAGYSWTDGEWSDTQRAAGFLDSIMWRAQAGVRVGTSFTLKDGVRVEPTFMGLAYSDVKVSGTSTTPGVVAAAPTDQGKLWGKGDAKVNFAFADNFSVAVEGEVHGTGNNGTGQTIGGSATLSLRKSW